MSKPLLKITKKAQKMLDGLCWGGLTQSRDLNNWQMMSVTTAGCWRHKSLEGVDGCWRQKSLEGVDGDLNAWWLPHLTWECGRDFQNMFTFCNIICIISWLICHTASLSVSWLVVLSNVAPPHFATKQQATRCFRSLKPNQTGLFMLMCSNIHLLGLLPNAQFGQTWHLSTQLHSGERTGSRLLWSTTPL